MNLKFSGIMIGTQSPKELASFYSKVFDKKPDWEDEKYYMWQVGGTSVTIGEHSEVHGDSKEPARIMFNFETKDVKGHFDRIKEVGAKVIAEPYTMGGDNMWLATLADPEGNYFQLANPWEESEEKAN